MSYRGKMVMQNITGLVMFFVGVGLFFYSVWENSAPLAILAAVVGLIGYLVACPAKEWIDADDAKRIMENDRR